MCHILEFCYLKKSSDIFKNSVISMSFSTFPATWWFQSWSSRNRTGQRMLSQTCFFFWSFNFMNFANRWHRRGIGKLCFYLDFWLVENIVHWYWIRDWRTADWLKIRRRKFCFFIEFDLWLTLFHWLLITWWVIWGHFVRTIGHFCPPTPRLIYDFNTFHAKKSLQLPRFEPWSFRQFIKSFLSKKRVFWLVIFLSLIFYWYIWWI